MVSSEFRIEWCLVSDLSDLSVFPFTSPVRGKPDATLAKIRVKAMLCNEWHFCIIEVRLCQA